MSDLKGLKDLLEFIKEVLTTEDEIKSCDCESYERKEGTKIPEKQSTEKESKESVEKTTNDNESIETARKFGVIGYFYSKDLKKVKKIMDELKELTIELSCLIDPEDYKEVDLEIFDVAKDVSTLLLGELYCEQKEYAFKVKHDITY